MHKLEIYKYLCDNSQKLFNRKGGILNIKKIYDIYKNIDYDFNDAEDLYDFLINEDTKCKLRTCDNKKRFRSFTTGYYDFCCKKCNNKWLSESRIGDNNPIHNISDENRKKWKATLSKQVKERIKKGDWTPGVTNSWCHSRYKITLNRGDKEITLKVRSSWEAFYQLLFPNLIYEQLRVPYKYNNNWHNYIVDFIDEENKRVIEIKPKSEQSTLRNIIKRDALCNWCKYNEYEYVCIDEDFFINLSWDEQLLEKQPDKLRLSKFKKYFKDEN